MALTTVFASKGAAEGYQPLLLADITFPDGTVLRLATFPLNLAEGSIQYGGVDYLGRLEKQDIDAIQALSAQGIDVIPSIRLHIADADSYIWTNYENTKGFRGAGVSLKLVLFDAVARTFSSDAVSGVFVGTCSGPMDGSNDERIIIEAASGKSMQRMTLPVLQIQPQCSLFFPTTNAQRTAAANNPGRGQCGYSPDVGGGNARGTYQTGTTPFTACDYTKESCVARGMYKTDSSARVTGHFTGWTWAPPKSWRSSDYALKQTVSGRNTVAKPGAYVPLVYGTQWVTPKIANVEGDGNSTRFECVLSYGQIGNVLKVIVNDFEVPCATAWDGSNYLISDRLFRWNKITTGTRQGAPNIDAGYDGLGDPYGSQATLLVVVPRSVAESSAEPSVKILTMGRVIPVPNTTNPADAPTWPRQYSSNPAWVLLDLLYLSGWSYSEIDLASFSSVATYCDGTVNYTSLTGASMAHSRYKCGFVIDAADSADNIIRQFKRAHNLVTIPNAAGLLGLAARQTLAGQQPATVAGSNYNTAVSSITAAGVAANGYVAHKFDESNIIQGSFGYRQRPLTDAPNRVQVRYQDEDNQYAESTISIIDDTDLTRTGQQIRSTLEVGSIVNFDQARRIAKQIQAEGLRGNATGSTAGTFFFTFETTQQAAHLQIEQLCLLSWQKLGLVNQLVRVNRIQPSQDYRRVKLTVVWHADAWYADAYGQSNAPLKSDPGRQRTDRAPMCWHPYAEAPIGSDPLVGSTERNFSIGQEYENLADGTALAKLRIEGRSPVNRFTTGSGQIQPPLMPVQGSTANTGGSLAGGQLVLIGLVGIDASGRRSPLSDLMRVAIPSGTSTNTATAGSLFWPVSPTSYEVYAGVSEDDLSRVATGAGAPSSVTVTALSLRGLGAPDGKFDHYHVIARECIHGGIWGAAATAVTSTTIKIAATLTVNQFAGRVVTLYGKTGSTANLPIADFTVSANAADGTLTVSPDPTSYVGVGDAVVMRTKPTTYTSTTIGDSLFVNPLATGGLTVNEEAGRKVYILYGTGRGQERRVISNTSTVLTVDSPFDPVPDATSVFVVLEAGRAYDAATEPLTVTDSNPATVPMVHRLRVDNLLNKSMFVQVLTSDAEGREALAVQSPVREIYLFGVPGAANSNNFPFYVLSPTTSPVAVNWVNGPTQKINAAGVSGGTLNISAPTGGVDGMEVKLLISPAGKTITFDAAYGIPAGSVDPTTGTYTTIVWKYEGTALRVMSLSTGVA